MHREERVCLICELANYINWTKERELFAKLQWTVYSSNSSPLLSLLVFFYFSSSMNFTKSLPLSLLSFSHSLLPRLRQLPPLSQHLLIFPLIIFLFRLISLLSSTPFHDPLNFLLFMSLVFPYLHLSFLSSSSRHNFSSYPPPYSYLSFLPHGFAYFIITPLSSYLLPSIFILLSPNFDITLLSPSPPSSPPADPRDWWRARCRPEPQRPPLPNGAGLDHQQRVVLQYTGHRAAFGDSGVCTQKERWV